MLYIHAANHRLANLAAREMKLPPTQWMYIHGAEQWRGMRGSSIVIVDSPRYTPNWEEQYRMHELEELIRAYENEVLEWIV
jgi:hypothetical protein